MEKVDLVNDLARLSWACRRGMLELDVLLGNFLKEAYPALNVDDKVLFIELLSLQDPVIHAWLMGHETPAEERFKHITDTIRRHARSRV
jgi:antitoxin CptB